MASRLVYPIVAVVGIAAASGAAWWFQTKPQANAAQAAPSNPPSPRGAEGPAGAGGPQGAGPLRPAGVEVAKVERIRLRDDAQTVGTLRSRQNVMLRPEVAGRVVQIGFTDGAQVRRGQVLVQLDDTLQRAELRQAQAQVSIAQANLKRNTELVAQNFVTQRVLDESSASLQVAEAQLALSCARLERMRIVAPFDGTVGIRSVNLGDYVKDGADLVNLEDIGTLYVDFRLPERYQTRVQRGQVVELQIDALPGRMFKARIDAIDPLIDANGRSIAVRAVMPNTGGEQMVAPMGGGRPGGGGAGPGAGPGAGARPPGASGPRPMSANSGAGGPRPGAGRPPQGAQGALPASPNPSATAGRPSAQQLGCPVGGLVAAADAAAPVGPAAAGSAPSRGGPLRPGMFARVTAVFGVKDDALAVPEEAIVPQAGRQFVIKVVEPSAVPGTATSALPPDVQFVSRRIEVRLGIRRPGRVEILEGVSEGETVVVAGQQRLQRDGTPLRVVELGRGPGVGGGPGGAGARPGAPGQPPAPGATQPAPAR